MTGILNLLMGTVRSAVVTDPYFEYTTLLLPGSGTNGAQNNTFLDSGTANGGVGFPITRNPLTGPNAPTQGTFSPFSQTGWGNYFNGSSRFNLASNVALTPGSGDFTIECWIYPTAAFSTYNGIFVGDATGAMNFGKISGGIGLRISGTSDIISATAPSINQWTHIAITRSGTDVRLFYNGEQQGSTVTNSTNFVQSATAIGDNGGGTAYWNGYISNLRFVKGRAVYTGAFTPPTTPLTRTTGGTNPPQGTECSLLTCQSNRFLDSNGVNVPASSPLTITPSGSPSVVAFSPFNPTASWSAATNGGSGYFDGSGDYLSAPNSTNLDVGTGDFSIEAWCYKTDTSTATDWRVTGGSASSSGFFGDGGTASSRGFGIGRAGVAWDVTSNVQAPIYEWFHICYTRKSGGVRIFLNGKLIAYAAGNTNNYGLNAGTLQIAAGQGGNLLTGYMTGFRLFKTVPASYDTTVTTINTQVFTPPTEPLTAITNTQLLLNFTNAGVYDATSKNDLETVGDAQISNAVTPKWGSTSIKFDGTGDYLVTDNSDNILGFGTGDWTIEFWLRLNSTGTQVIFDGRRSSSADVAPLVYYLSGLKYYTAGGDRISGGTLSTGVWYYIAIVKSSGSTRMYIDGSQTGSTYTDGNNYTQQSQRPIIGAEGVSVGSNPLNGYIQDFRITKGYARPTTTPTAAFPTL